MRTWQCYCEWGLRAGPASGLLDALGLGYDLLDCSGKPCCTSIRALFAKAQQKTMILEAEEFIRRFLLHVLPDGFQRIRYYGFLGNRYREQKLAHCRELLAMPTPESPALETAKDYRERYEELTGSSLWQCPVCRQGRMLVTQVLPRRPPRQVSIKDTS